MTWAGVRRAVQEGSRVRHFRSPAPGLSGSRWRSSVTEQVQEAAEQFEEWIPDHGRSFPGELLWNRLPRVACHRRPVSSIELERQSNRIGCVSQPDCRFSRPAAPSVRRVVVPGEMQGGLSACCALACRLARRPERSVPAAASTRRKHLVRRRGRGEAARKGLSREGAQASSRACGPGAMRPWSVADASLDRRARVCSRHPSLPGRIASGVARRAPPPRRGHLAPMSSPPICAGLRRGFTEFGGVASRHDRVSRRRQTLLA